MTEQLPSPSDPIADRAAIIHRRYWIGRHGDRVPPLPIDGQSRRRNWPSDLGVMARCSGGDLASSRSSPRVCFASFRRLSNVTDAEDRQ